MIELAIAGGLVLACVVFILKRNSSGPRGQNVSTPLPPGPAQSLVLGNFKDIDTNRVHQCLDGLFQKYGPIVQLRLLKRNIVVLNSAEVITKAFAGDEYTEHLNDKSMGFYGTHLVYGHMDVLLGPYSDRTFRLKDVMHRGLMPSMCVTSIRKEATTLVEKLTKYESSVDFDPSKTLEELLCEVFSMLISGESRPSDVEVMWDFVNWSNKLLNPSVESLLKNFPFLRHLPGKHGFLYNTAKAKRDRLLKRYLDESKESYKEGINRSLVDTCLHIQHTERGPQGDAWLTDDMIRALILDTIGGGLVTTTNTVLATILNLLHNRPSLNKMLAEIRTHIGPEDTVTPALMSNMPYCYAVIFETQRLCTLVPICSHFCSKQDIEFEGYKIRKGTMVWGNIWSAHHDDNVWTDPWGFRPERFLTDKGSLLPKDHICMKTMIPLGVGKRYCVGSDFAMQRIFTYVTTIVQHFDILPPKETELLSNDPNLYDAGAVLQLKKFTCRMARRST